MKSATRERLVYFVAMAAAVLAALGALVVGGDLEDLEVTLVMVAAVIAGLVCFDTSMERRLHSFAPWLLLSIAPVAKTVPMVWQVLREESGASFERYDHAGTLLFALFVCASVVLLARPSPSLGTGVGLFDRFAILGSAAVAAVAGASVAFLFDRDFGSPTAGRVLETPTWFFIGGTLAAAVIAISRAHAPPPALAGVSGIAAASTGLVAFSVAGGEFDRGWWAAIFAGLTLSAAATGGDLGRTEDRSRLTNAPVVVALVAGVVAAASAISARSDPLSWSPGWALLGVLSLAMFALAMASRPLEDQRRRLAAADLTDSLPTIGLDDAARAARAKQRALARLNEADLSPEAPTAMSGPSVPAPMQAAKPATPAPSTGPRPAESVAGVAPGSAESVAGVAPGSAESVAGVAPGSAESVAGVAPGSTDLVAGVAPGSPESVAGVAPGSTDLVADVAPAVARPQPPPAPVPTVAHASPRSVPAEPGPSSAVPPKPAAASATPEPARAPMPLSDGTIVATARAAAEVRTARATDRHSLAPLAQAHHFDPSTGLLSAAGLQHAIARAFDVPRQAAHVTIMMFMIRDLDRIEREHGRLASAAVTREVAERVTKLLPDGSGARFARSAYAIVFVADMSDTNHTIQRLARVLLQLRAPVEGGSLGDKIDVVAGMAQCYEGEDSAQFVRRANAGLARAAQSPEPTFVAMP